MKRSGGSLSPVYRSQVSIVLSTQLRSVKMEVKQVINASYVVINDFTTPFTRFAQSPVIPSPTLPSTPILVR
ncbi:hypothetical protein KOW79_017606 [Hemibagrus wyckioides]|uniref:Uncharacterized protein n=1 Tax=Hemibagrus wyckioides TaxID=337641 RepID=A0A9D3SCK5_9TELE|nr:hypothetical protein KOW79_017606 [Hemibagrus wyckioides]